MASWGHRVDPSIPHRRQSVTTFARNKESATENDGFNIQSPCAPSPGLFAVLVLSNRPVRFELSVFSFFFCEVGALGVPNVDSFSSNDLLRHLAAKGANKCCVVLKLTPIAGVRGNNKLQWKRRLSQSFFEERTCQSQISFDK